MSSLARRYEMKIVKINNDGFLSSPYIADAETEIEVEDVVYEQLMECKIGKNWRYVDGEFIAVDILDDEVIRLRREIECFSLVDNRSSLWFNHLSPERKDELDAWYEAWLKATETKIIPTKPEWLN